MQHDGRGQPRHEQADARDEPCRQSGARFAFLVGRVEVVDEGVRLAECAARERCREDERETDGHADEHERRCEAPHFGYRHEPGIRQKESQCRAREDDGDAQRKLPRENAHGLIVPGHVLLGLSRRNAGGPVGRTAGQVARHQLVERAFEQNAHFQQLVHLGIRALGLPFRHRLSADAQQHGKLLLRHVARSA